MLLSHAAGTSLEINSLCFKKRNTYICIDNTQHHTCIHMLSLCVWPVNINFNMATTLEDSASLRSGEQSALRLYSSKTHKKSEAVFVAQISIIFIVIVSAILNLSLGSENQSGIWISLLSTSLGLLAPAPSLKKLIVKPAPAQPITALTWDTLLQERSFSCRIAPQNAKQMI